MSMKHSLSSRSIPFFLLIAFPSLSVGSLTCAQGHEGHGKGGDHPESAQEHPAAEGFRGDPYLLDIDPVSGKPLGPIEKQIVLQHEGRELRFSSQENAEAFKADPAKFLAGVDKRMIEAQLPFYPLETCMVSGEKLGGEMGEPIDFVFKNRLIRFCCKDCKPTFLKDPAKYIAELDKAVVAKQLASYPLKTCLVSGEELGGEMGEPIDRVYGNRLVRFCCKSCPKKLEKDPLKYLGELGHDEKAEHEGHGKHEHGHDDDEGDR